MEKSFRKLTDVGMAQILPRQRIRNSQSAESPMSHVIEHSVLRRRAAAQRRRHAAD
jgi:hypothetical protein